MESSRVFVKNLPPTITEAEFRKHFSAQGRDVTDVKLIPKRRIGFVGYRSPEDASKAVKYFNRTYIRMSRIAVESAKPISDPALEKTQHQKHGSTTTAPDHRGKPQLSPGEDTNAKKRKRDDLDEADPKLQEFLEVMNHGHVLKKARDGNMTDIDEGTHPPAPAVQEDESDDEYEDIPSQQQARIPPRKEPQSVEVPVDPQVDRSTAQIEEGPVIEAPSVQPDATDDEWLRSRTNRLLDLVDPDDLPCTKQQKNVDSPVADHPPVETDIVQDNQDPAPTEQQDGESALELIRKTSRVFVRNLPYSATEDDLREHFKRFGELEEVRLPANQQGQSKGYAMISFQDPEAGVAAFQNADRSTFQGRIIHLLPAAAKRDHTLDEFALSKLPLKKQNLIKKKASAASNSFNWNSLFMSQDAVNESVAHRLGVSKASLLDPTSADAGVKQAIAETSLIQEAKAYFLANGVDLNAFKSQQRGDTSILVKNFPFGTTIEELRKLFEEHGTVLHVLMPPSGTIAIIQFVHTAQAKAAFAKLAYRRIKDSVLFLEKGPKTLFTAPLPTPVKDDQPARPQKLSVAELLERGDAQDQLQVSSLFVRNLNFATTTAELAETFKSLDGFVSARVKTKTDPKKPGQLLSMGFGFVEFRTKEQAQAALKVMDGYTLAGHSLTVKASHRGLDAAEERRREDLAKKAAGQRTKIVIKNLPFEATKQDVRKLVGTYGQLRSVRVPKKFNNSSRGFAFAEFVTPREAENALNALKDTHLLGRRLVLDFAEAEALDAEEEIAKLQKKVGGQVNKVTLQQLTGGGRKRVNIGDQDEDEA